MRVAIQLQAPHHDLLEALKRKIQDTMHFTLFSHPEKHLLFTTLGRRHLQELSDRTAYLHWDNTSSALRIYGTKQQQETASGQLVALVQELRLMSFQVPFFLRKESTKGVRQNLGKIRAVTQVEELFLTGRRIRASGTKQAIQALEEALAKDICPKPTSPSSAATGGECPLCFDEFDTPYTLQACNHCFCMQCIQPMLGLDNVDIPVKCPICAKQIVLRDILSIAEPFALDRIRQQAVSLFLRAHPTKFCPCFKTGCPQILQLSSSGISEIQEIQQGGRVVWCDQCQDSYCTKCSKAGIFTTSQLHYLKSHFTPPTPHPAYHTRLPAAHAFPPHTLQVTHTRPNKRTRVHTHTHTHSNSHSHTCNARAYISIYAIS